MNSLALWLSLSRRHLMPKQMSTIEISIGPVFQIITFLCIWFSKMLAFKNVFYLNLQSPPYSMYRDSDKRLTGNDVFEGYAIDLIKEVAEILSKSCHTEIRVQLQLGYKHWTGSV